MTGCCHAFFWSGERRGAIMTTTLIYEPIASISDDYFRGPKASGSESRRDNTGDQSLVQTGRLALNITDGNAGGVTSCGATITTNSASSLGAGASGFGSILSATTTRRHSPPIPTIIT